MKAFLRLPIRIAMPRDPGAFRLFLALLVFVHHFSSFAVGGSAVYVFFMLSGFWIQRMWCARYAKARSPYLTYALSRLWRLAPVMIVVSALTVPLLWLLEVPMDASIDGQWAHLAFSTFFFLGYAWLDYLPVAPAWSLDVEMQFYLFAPLLALLVAKVDFRVFLFAAGVVSGVSYFLLPHVVMPVYLIFFAIGIVAAKQNYAPTARIASASAIAIILLLVVLTASAFEGALWLGADPGVLAKYNSALNVILALLAIPFAFHTVHRPTDGVDKLAADLSYIIYLAHWAGALWFYQVEGPIGERLVVAVTCFVLVPAVSFAIWLWIDRPLNERRAAWVRSRMPVAVTPSPANEPAGP